MVWRPSVNIVTLYKFQFLVLPVRKKREKILMSHSSHVFDLFFLSSVNAYKTITYQKKTIQRTYCENICLTFRRLAIGGLKKKEYAVGRCHKWAISNGIPSFVRNDPLLVNVITAAIIFVKTIFIAKFLQKKKKRIQNSSNSTKYCGGPESHILQFADCHREMKSETPIDSVEQIEISYPINHHF